MFGLFFRSAKIYLKNSASTGPSASTSTWPLSTRTTGKSKKPTVTSKKPSSYSTQWYHKFPKTKNNNSSTCPSDSSNSSTNNALFSVNSTSTKRLWLFVNPPCLSSKKTSKSYWNMPKNSTHFPSRKKTSTESSLESKYTHLRKKSLTIFWPRWKCHVRRKSPPL